MLVCNESVLCVDVKGKEYRIGRPRVYKTEVGYEMYYTWNSISKEYIVGYATSSDGVHWKKQDELFKLPKSETGWDSKMACYPVLLKTKSIRYMFYNGNRMGKTGVGYGILV